MPFVKMFFDKKDILPIIEAIIFYENDIVNIDKIVKLTGFDRDTIINSINELNLKYEENNHAFFIDEVDNGYFFNIKKKIFNELKEVYNIKSKTKLSQSVLTVLSIIAYKQPITKSELEDIRGVSSDNAIKILLEKNLIEIVGRKDVIGRPLMYGTTVEFLKFFNLKSIKDLPAITELKSEEFVINE